MLFIFRARGPYALWAPAWLRTDPLSEPVPTPSGLGGLLRSVHKKPEWAWEIDSYAVLSPIRYETLARSAHKSVATAGTDGDPDRMPQRQTALADVDYLICGRAYVYKRALRPGRQARDYGPIIHEHLSHGVPHYVPHGGRSEFVLNVEYLGPADRNGPGLLRDVCYEQGVRPIDVTEDLGPMLVDLLHDGGRAFGDERARPIYRRLTLDRGIVEVPPTAYNEKRRLDEEAQIAYRERFGHKPEGVDHAAVR